MLGVALAFLAVCQAEHQGISEEAGAAKRTVAAMELPVGIGDWRSFGWKVGTSHADVLRLGNKFRLSGVGDRKSNDDWLRLFDSKNRGFYGGFAAGKLWGKTTIATHLQLGNRWRLSAEDESGDDWLRLAPAKGKGYYGGFAAKKLRTDHLTVAGRGNVQSLSFGTKFALMPLSKGDHWLRLVDPVSKVAPKKGGLALGKMQANEVAVADKLTTKVLQLGNLWTLSADASKAKKGWLRLMDVKGEGYRGGFASHKIWSQNLKVTKKASFTGTVVFEQATFTGKVSLTKLVKFDQLSGKTVKVGGIVLSNKGKKHDNNDWLHVYRGDKVTYGGVALRRLWATSANANVVTLGKKWRLSAIGDNKFKNDDWLRLMNTKGTGYYGGLAAKKLWTAKAYNHVLQLGTKWRLSGVGDKLARSKHDSWLRLMDARNTRLYGGFMSAKMWTKNLEVKGAATVTTLSIGKRYRLAGSSQYLRLMDGRGKNLMGGFQMQRLKTAKLIVSGTSTFGNIRSGKQARAGVLVADKYLQIQHWRLGPPQASKAKAKVANAGWLQLTSAKSHAKLENLEVGKFKATDLASSGTASLKKAIIKTMKVGSQSVANLRISGKVHVAKELWVGKQKIVPLPSSLLDDVENMKAELAELRAQLAEFKK